MAFNVNDLVNKYKGILSQAPISVLAKKIAPPIQNQVNRLSQNVGDAIRGPISPIPPRGVERVTQPVRQFTGNLVQDYIQRLPSKVGSAIRVSPVGQLTPRSPREQIGQAGNALSLALDVGTLPFAGGVAVNTAKQLGKQGLKVAIKQGAKEGAKFGAAYGGLESLFTEKDQQDVRKYIQGIVTNTAIGAGVGGALGGVAGGVGFAGGKILGKIKELTSHTSDGIQQLRNLRGQWMAGQTPIKPKGMPKPQWDFQLRFNEKYGRNPYAPVYSDDLQKAFYIEAEKRVGMQARPKGADIIPEKPDVTKGRLSDVGGVGDLADVKARLMNVQVLTDADKQIVQNAKTAEDLAPVLKKLDGGSLAKFFNSGQGQARNVAQPPVNDVTQFSQRGTVPTNVAQKVKGFEAEMDALAAKTKVDLSTVKPKKVRLIENAVKVPSDQATKEQAALRGGGFTGKPSNDILDAFANWVNARKASKIEGIVKGREFADLNNRGLQGIFDFQKGDVPGNHLAWDKRFGDVKRYFDKKYKLLKDSGIDFHYKSDYLPQLWVNSPEEVQQVFRRLGLKPSFAIDSVFKNYQEGIAAGLTPKFGTVGDLVTWYEAKANKALADRSFFELLGKNGLVLPRSEALNDWVTLDPDRFPRITMKTDTGVFTGDYKAPPELADMINNYLRDPQDKIMNKIADFVSGIKNRVLSAGIPYTGWNAHGFNILARNTLAEKNPVMGMLRAANWLTRPQEAEKFINTNMKDAAFGVKHGLTFDIEDHVFQQAEKEATSVFGKIEQVRSTKYGKWFEDPLFQKALPAIKLHHFQELYKDFSKSMSSDVAAKRAANVANDIFGGINWQQWGRSRDTQNFLRAVILAPDWAETNFRLAKGILDVKNPAGKAYRTVARNLFLAYSAANVVNYLNTGHLMAQNDPGNEFNIETGTYTDDGKKRFIRVFGTAADFIRIPVEIAIGLAKGDPTPAFRAIRNRLSIPLATGVSLATNTNYMGQAIYGKDKYGNELGTAKSAAGIAGELSPYIPGVPYTQVNAFVNLITGRNNLEQSVAQAIEAPIRYKGFTLSKTKKPLEDVAKSEGIRGKGMYEFKKQVSSESPLGEKQREKATIGGTEYIKSVYDQREQNKKVEDYKEAVKSGDQEKAKSLLDNIFAPSSKASATKETSSVFVPVRKKDGTIDIIDTSFQPQKPTLTGQAELDKKLISKYSGEITKKSNDIVALYEGGKLTQEEAEKALQELKSSKLKASGGKKKGRKPSFRIKSVKFPKIKLAKIKKIKVPRLKKQKNYTLKVPKIKKMKVTGRLA